MKDLKSAVLLIAALAIVSAGCAKAPEDAGPPSQANKNAANANVEDLSRTPLYSKTIRGDVERADLAISMARDMVKQQQWNDAMIQLRAAQTQIEDAMGKNPPLKELYEDLKSALGRTIQSAENRSGDIERQLTDLQTRVGALKVHLAQ